jgi:hypothetical protein
VARASANDRSVVLVEQDEEDPDEEKKVTGYGLHASRLVSAMLSTPARLDVSGVVCLCISLHVS